MLDVGYISRLLVLNRRYKGQKNTKNIFSESVVNGSCSLNDLDTLWHMNNSRYLRECDFGRHLLFIETGLLDVLVQRRKSGMKNCNVVVSALQAQYRRSVELGDKFHIRTRINGWDDRAFYLEQSMILDKNQETAFLLLVRLALTTNSLTPQMLIDDLQIGLIQSPPLSPTMESFKQNHRLTYKEIKSKI